MMCGMYTFYIQVILIVVVFIKKFLVADKVDWHCHVEWPWPCVVRWRLTSMTGAPSHTQAPLRLLPLLLDSVLLLSRQSMSLHLWPLASPLTSCWMSMFMYFVKINFQIALKIRISAEVSTYCLIDVCLFLFDESLINTVLNPVSPTSCQFSNLLSLHGVDSYMYVLICRHWSL